MSGTGITWNEFYSFLTGPAGCVEVGWHPGTHVTLRQPNGREFGTCKPQKTGYVSVEHFVHVANEFAKSKSDMEIWMGRRPPGKSKMTAKRADRTVKEPPKPVKLDPIIDLAQRIQTRAVAIARSGPVRRHAKFEQHKQLQALADRLDHWFHDLDSSGAA